MIKKVFIRYVSFLVLSLFTVSVQNSVSATTTPPQSAPVDAVVANLDSQIVKVEERSGVYTGVVLLKNNMGRQNNISLGIVALSKDRTALDVHVIKSGESLRENELKQYSFAYTLPKNIGGEFSLVFTVESNGLLLSQHIIKELKLPKQSSISCSVSKSDPKVTFPVVTCLTTAKTVDVSMTDYGYLGNLTKVQTVTGTNDKVSFTPKVPLGKHYLFITAGETGQKTSLLYTTLGEYGSIINVLVAIKNTIPELTVALKDAVTNGRIHVYATDTKSSKCFEGDVVVTGSFAKSLLDKKCKEGTIKVELYSASGTLLDSKSGEYSTIPYTVESTVVAKDTGKASHRVVVYIVTFLALAVVSIGAFTRYKKSKGGNQVV